MPSPHLLAVLSGKVDDLVRAPEGKGTAVGFGTIPFHAIFRRDRAELILVLHNVRLRGVAADCQRGTDILAAPRYHRSVESGGLTAVESERCSVWYNSTIGIGYTYSTGLPPARPLKARAVAVNVVKRIVAACQK